MRRFVLWTFGVVIALAFAGVIASLFYIEQYELTAVLLALALLATLVWLSIREIRRWWRERQTRHTANQRPNDASGDGDTSRQDRRDNLRRALVCLVVGTLWFLLWITHPIAAMIVAGFAVGVVILGVISPFTGVIQLLKYEPMEKAKYDTEGKLIGVKKPMWFLPVFVNVDPGRVIAVLRGGEIVRFLMNWEGWRFRREGLPSDTQRYGPKDDRYSDVVKGDDRHAYPQAYWLSPWSWWVTYVFRRTGLMFAGIWPWQGPEIRDLMLTKLVRIPPEPGMHGDRSQVVHEQSYSIHLRVREFQRRFVIHRVETSDGLEVSLVGNLRGRFVNPKLGLFGVDHWDQALDDALQNRGAGVARGMPSDALLTIRGDDRIVQNDDVLFALSRATETINVKMGTGAGTNKLWGYEVIEVQITQIEPHFRTEQEKQAFAERWLAAQYAAGYAIRAKAEGEGEALKVRLMADELSKHPDLAQHILTAETIQQASENGAPLIFAPFAQNPTPSLLAEQYRQNLPQGGTPQPKRDDRRTPSTKKRG